jgi:transcriptional regulator with XRE-family HTH domain
MLQQRIINMAIAFDVNQSGLAEATNLSQSTISRILSKKTKFPSYSTLLKINAYLTSLNSGSKPPTNTEPSSVIQTVIDIRNTNQSELSHLTGIPQPTISKILSGQSARPRYETMSRLMTI